MKAVLLVDGTGATIQNLTPTVAYLHEDRNTDDRTVVEVRTARPVAPGETARFKIARSLKDDPVARSRSWWFPPIPMGLVGPVQLMKAAD